MLWCQFLFPRRWWSVRTQASSLTWTNRKPHKHLEHLKDFVSPKLATFSIVVLQFIVIEIQCGWAIHAVLLAVSWLAHDSAHCELFLPWPTTNGTKVYICESSCAYLTEVRVAGTKTEADRTWLTAWDDWLLRPFVITTVHDDWAEARVEGSIRTMMATKKGSHKMARN